MENKEEIILKLDELSVMENNDKVVIKVENLPPRAAELSLEKLTNIFGGGGSFGASCDKPTDCISLVCKEGHCSIATDTF